MGILKKIVFFILALIGLFLLVGLIVDKEYTVSHTITINKPQEEVFNYMKLFKNQEKYSVWVMADPNIKLKYEGEDGTVGAKVSWDGNDDVGAGSQTITKMTNERIDVDLHFIRPMEGNQKGATIVKAIDGNSCSVTEEFYGNDPYPMNALSFIGKYFIQDAFTKNGENVKKILEK
ncbi:MAG: hypothetical protein A3G95_00690 [Flavobacteria bacterium RIFCSPLOWO2_12_FULL_31_7]|jgi:hypothetical protein|nr:MAG: hypothetical protein A3G95_00690 [Flavobacteria bacterium RIFCSPLOWO2_12_FULL_31_7]